MGKVGRNEPCPCGSGKKYKKCHLAADEEKESAAQKDLARTVTALDDEDFEFWENEELSSGQGVSKAAEEFEDTFNSADFEGKVGILRNFLTTNVPPDAESIQYYFDDLWAEAENPRQYEVCGELVQLLQELHGNIFEEIGGLLLDDCVRDAVVDGRLDAATALFAEYGRFAARNIDAFMRRADQLAYHGLLDALLGGFRGGWPGVRASQDLSLSEIEAFARRAVSYEIFSGLEGLTSGILDQSDLLLRVGYFQEWTERDLRECINLLKHGLDAELRREDFAVSRSALDRNPSLLSPFLEKLDFLIHAFRQFLHREKGLSLTQADLAGAEMMDFVLDRLKGNLKAGRGRKGTPAYWEDKTIKTLCPDPSTLDSYFAPWLGLANFDEHRAMSMWTAIPHWMEFLERIGLVAAPMCRDILKCLSPILKDVSRFAKENDWEMASVAIAIPLLPSAGQSKETE